MTTDRLIELFEKHGDEEHLKRDGKQRNDLTAFLLLRHLVPENCDMVTSAEHDQIWLSVELDDLASSKITEDDVIELLRCGVMLDSDIESLSMFV